MFKVGTKVESAPTSSDVRLMGVKVVGKIVDAWVREDGVPMCLVTGKYVILPECQFPEIFTTDGGKVKNRQLAQADFIAA